MLVPVPTFPRSAWGCLPRRSASSGLESDGGSAAHVFFGKPLSAEFGKLAYPEETGGIDWDVPK
ncbi:MAG TPA: hypothetical protein VGH33_03050 [Isosphaeraceae bacterium]|jgi:hypothetical protein